MTVNVKNALDKICTKKLSLPLPRWERQNYKMKMQQLYQWQDCFLMSKGGFEF